MHTATACLAAIAAFTCTLSAQQIPASQPPVWSTRPDVAAIIPLPGTHSFASFGHLAGYSSAYYTYLWDKVIAEDFFTQFDQKNLLAGEAPMRYRRLVVEPGGSASANDLVKQFLSRPQNLTAFQRWMNEEFER
jgi:thimet oligopeptidase